MFQHIKLCIWKEHAPVAICFGMFHPFFKPPAGTSHLLELDIRGESSVIQPILVTPLIINWKRPKNYGQGNKTEQDTPSIQPPATTDTTCTPLLAMHGSETQQHIFIPHISSLQCRCQQQQGRTGVLPNSFPAYFCWRSGTVLGLKDGAEKSSFLPAEGSGTHRPASKCV